MYLHFRRNCRSWILSDQWQFALWWCWKMDAEYAQWDQFVPGQVFPVFINFYFILIFHFYLISDSSPRNRSSPRTATFGGFKSRYVSCQSAIQSLCMSLNELQFCANFTRKLIIWLIENIQILKNPIENLSTWPSPHFSLSEDDIRGIRYLYLPWAWNRCKCQKYALNSS
jgi:hypothetical protein